MEWIRVLLQLPLLAGGIFIITGMVLYLFPPGKINGLYGYRTAASMQSTERWNFAQKYSAKEIIKSGFFLVLISMINLVINVKSEIEFVVSIAIVLVFVFIPIYRTEKAIRKKFATNYN